EVVDLGEVGDALLERALALLERIDRARGDLLADVLADRAALLTEAVLDVVVDLDGLVDEDRGEGDGRERPERAAHEGPGLRHGARHEAARGDRGPGALEREHEAVAGDQGSQVGGGRRGARPADRALHDRGRGDLRPGAAEAPPEEASEPGRGEQQGRLAELAEDRDRRAEDLGERATDLDREGLDRGEQLV